METVEFLFWKVGLVFSADVEAFVTVCVQKERRCPSYGVGSCQVMRLKSAAKCQFLKMMTIITGS